MGRARPVTMWDVAKRSPDKKGQAQRTSMRSACRRWCRRSATSAMRYLSYAMSRGEEGSSEPAAGVAGIRLHLRPSPERGLLEIVARDFSTLYRRHSRIFARFYLPPHLLLRIAEYRAPSAPAKRTIRA